MQTKKISPIVRIERSVGYRGKVKGSPSVRYQQLCNDVSSIDFITKLDRTSLSDFVWCSNLGVDSMKTTVLYLDDSDVFPFFIKTQPKNRDFKN